MSDADWTARKNLITGLAHYLNGKLYHNENNFAKADVELRAALPLVEGNAAVKPEVLYMLALSNFKTRTSRRKRRTISAPARP